MRRGGTIFIIVGVLLALATAAVAYVMMAGRGAGPEPTEATPTPEAKIPVVIALQDIPAYSDIPAEAVGTQDIAESKLTNHLLAPEAVVGRRAARTILRGSFIMADWIVDPQAVAQEGVNASLNITPDREGRSRVAMAFETSELYGVAGAIQNGDFVDMLISYRLIDREEELEPAAEGEQAPEPTQMLVAQLLLQDIEVYRVGPWLIPTPTPVPEGEEAPAAEEVEAEVKPLRSNTLTLLLTQQDALVVKFARESGATIDLVLRGRDDHSTVRTETVTLQYVMTRFEITPPTEPPRYVPVVTAE
jgi:Flp pilus assembly protein CpaB